MIYFVVNKLLQKNRGKMKNEFGEWWRRDLIRGIAFT